MRFMGDNKGLPGKVRNNSTGYGWGSDYPGKKVSWIEVILEVWQHLDPIQFLLWLWMCWHAG